MALSARVPDGSDLTGLCRHKLEGIFDMHGVKTGSRADVPGFLEKLHGDRYFAMDFWALVESLEGVRDRITEEQIRRTVAECVCGWVPRGDPALTGIEEAFNARAASREASTGRATETPAEPGLRIVEHLEQNPASMADHPAAMDDVAASTNTVYQTPPTVELEASAASGNLGKIDQILSRLELNDHELKLLLESIESRISRLEPHVEELTSQVIRTQRPVAASISRASTGRTLAEYSRQTADRAGRQLAATNVAVGSWGSRIFSRMDAGLDKVGERFAVMDATAKRWGSGVKQRVEPATASLKKAGARTRAAVARATSAAATGTMKCRAAATDWFERRRAMLVHVSTTLGVVACLALVIWLWGRPRGYMARATPVAASSTAPAPAPAITAPVAALPTPEAKPDPQTAPEPAAEASSTQPTSAPPEEVEAAVVAVSGVQRIAAKGTLARESYTAPPSIKWYNEDGTEQPAAPAAEGAKTDAPANANSAAPSQDPAPPAKRRTP